MNAFSVLSDYNGSREAVHRAASELARLRDVEQAAERQLIELLRALPPGTSLFDGGSVYWLAANGDIEVMRAIYAHQCPVVHVEPAPAPEADDDDAGQLEPVAAAQWEC